MRHEFPRGLRDAILLAFGMGGITVQQFTGNVYEPLTVVFVSCILGTATLRLDEKINRVRKRGDRE